MAAIIISPNGGESWNHGEHNDISWTGGGSLFCGGVWHFPKLYYSTNAGVNWILITTNAGGSPYDWVVPNTPSPHCLVKYVWPVSCVPASGEGWITYYDLDVSDAEFTIVGASSTVTITDPDGGEDWEVGTSHNITWTSTGEIDHFRIKYSKDNGVNWITVEDPATSPYEWTIPDTPAVNCLVKIEALAANDAVLASDVSDAVFTISGGTGSGYKAKSQIIG